MLPDLKLVLDQLRLVELGKRYKLAKASRRRPRPQGSGRRSQRFVIASGAVVKNLPPPSVVTFGLNERVLWRPWATWGHTDGQVDGTLFFSSERIVFVPTTLGWCVGGQMWDCTLANTFVSVCPGAWRPKNTLMNWVALQSMLEIECRTGGTQYFWLRHPASWVRRRIRRVLDEAANDDDRDADILVLDPSGSARQRIEVGRMMASEAVGDGPALSNVRRRRPVGGGTRNLTRPQGPWR